MPGQASTALQVVERTALVSNLATWKYPHMVCIGPTSTRTCRSVEFWRELSDRAALAERRGIAFKGSISGSQEANVGCQALSEKSLKEHQADENLRLAVERRVEIIGEAASHISDAFRAADTRPIPAATEVAIWEKVCFWNITQALAFDLHFEQAGFQALLRRDPT